MTKNMFHVLDVLVGGIEIEVHILQNCIAI